MKVKRGVLEMFRGPGGRHDLVGVAAGIDDGGVSLGSVGRSQFFQSKLKFRQIA